MLSVFLLLLASQVAAHVPEKGHAVFRAMQAPPPTNQSASNRTVDEPKDDDKKDDDGKKEEGDGEQQIPSSTLPPGACADGTECPAPCAPGVQCATPPACCTQRKESVVTCWESSSVGYVRCPAPCPVGMVCPAPPSCCIRAAKCIPGSKCLYPMPEYVNNTCTYTRLMDITTACSTPKDSNGTALTGTALTSALNDKCASTSACMTAVAAITDGDCKNSPNKWIAQAVLLIPQALCSKDSTGGYCARHWTPVAKTTDACVKHGMPDQCFADETCRWTGRRCIPAPTAAQLDGWCGECEAIVLRLHSRVRGMLQKQWRIDEDKDDNDGDKKRRSLAHSFESLAVDNEIELEDDEHRVMCTRDGNNFCFTSVFTPPAAPNVTTEAQLAAITSTAVADYCTAAGQSTCVRKLHYAYFSVGAQSYYYGQLQSGVPGHVLCSQDTNNNWCFPPVSQLFTTNPFKQCWYDATNNTCTSSCSDTISAGLSGLGCCAYIAPNVASQTSKLIGRWSSLSSIDNVCPNLWSIDILLNQQCGLKTDDSPVGPGFSMNILIGVPCRLLQYNTIVLKHAIKEDIAYIAGIDDDSIINMQLACAPTGVYVPLRSGVQTLRHVRRLQDFKRHVMRRAFRALATAAFAPSQMLATRVVFTVRAGADTDLVRQTLSNRLTVNSNSVSFSETQFVVVAKCDFCGDVTVLQPPALSAITSTAATTGTCDAAKLAVAFKACSEGIEAVGNATDAGAAAKAQEVCAWNSKCSVALRDLGVENLKHCKLPWNYGHDQTLIYFSMMCLNNTAGDRCLTYIRERDAEDACEKLSYTSCLASSTCVYEMKEHKCEARMTTQWLDGMCGTCASAWARTEAAFGTMGNGALMSTLCGTVNNQYCSIMHQEEEIAAARAGQTDNKEEDTPAVDMCGPSDKARCWRMTVTRGLSLSQAWAKMLNKHCTSIDCARSVAEQLQSAATIEHALGTGCMQKANGTYCLDISNRQGKNEKMMQCFNGIVMTNQCPAEPANCTQHLGAMISELGCCTRQLQAQFALQTQNAKATDRITMTTEAPRAVGLLGFEPCLPNIASTLASASCMGPGTVNRKIYKKRLAIKQSCAVLPQIRSALITELPKDIAAAAGVPVSAISNVDPKCDAAVTVTATHRFHALATAGGIAVDYELKAENDAITDQASADIDRQIASNQLALTNTQTAAVEACSTCGSLEVDQTQSRTLEITTESGAMSVASIGLAVFAAVQLLVVLLML